MTRMEAGEPVIEGKKECIMLENNAQVRTDQVLQAMLRISLFHIEALKKLDLGKEVFFCLLYYFVLFFPVLRVTSFCFLLSL